jgi:hypothetical protein
MAGEMMWSGGNIDQGNLGIRGAATNYTGTQIRNCVGQLRLQAISAIIVDDEGVCNRRPKPMLCLTSSIHNAV